MTTGDVTAGKGNRMMRRCVLTVVVLLVIGFAATAGARGPAGQNLQGTALAATDTTPPSLVVEPYPRYRIGSQINTDREEGYWDADFRLQWKVTDPSGICSQTVAWSGYESIGGETDPVLGDWTAYYSVAASARTFDFPSDVYNYDRGPDVFLVRSTDCAGNTATSDIAVTVFGLRENNDPGINYTGRWAVSNFQGFSGGTTAYSTRAGDSFTTTFTGDGPVALVMEKAANRGSADVYVDGVFRKTINTNASKTKHRVVVWQAIYKPGTHTLRVVNRGTAGHPRIDLDAILLCQGTTVTGWSC